MDRAFSLSSYRNPPDAILAANGYVNPLNRAMGHAFLAFPVLLRVKITPPLHDKEA